MGDELYNRPIIERPRTPWTFPISIFKDYVQDNDQRDLDCFEFDWNQMKFPKMTDEETEDVKKELK